jgi:hypothetical protein
MFGCVSWKGDGFDQQVLDMLPDRTLACYFLPNALVFKVPDVTSFLNVRAQMAALAQQNAQFDFLLSVHTSQDTFGGHAYYQLPPAFQQIVG